MNSLQKMKFSFVGKTYSVIWEVVTVSCYVFMMFQWTRLLWNFFECKFLPSDNKADMLFIEFELETSDLSTILKKKKN